MSESEEVDDRMQEYNLKSMELELGVILTLIIF